MSDWEEIGIWQVVAICDRFDSLRSQIVTSKRRVGSRKFLSHG